MLKTKQHNNRFLTHLGAAIRTRRLDMLQTQQELASATELHRTYITDVEAGMRNISMLTYNKVTDALLCALSLPMIEAERTMGILSTSTLYGKNGRLSKASKSLHSDSRFCLDLNTVALELEVKASMSKLQAATETFAREHKTYPRDEGEVAKALRNQLLINPFTKVHEQPSIGTAIDEELATRKNCFLRPGEIEYSPVKKGANYIIRGGGADGQGLVSHSPGSTYVLSGNLRTDNQP